MRLFLVCMATFLLFQVEKENLKMERCATEKGQQKIEEAKNKKLLDDFLSKKCNQGAEKC